MSIVKENSVIENFTAEMTSGKTFNLSDYQGKKVVLYFYPKDNTSGCTKESEDFRDHYAAFQEKNVEIFGISREKIRSHENFKAKVEMPFELISDPDEAICNQFDVMKEKSMYGRKYMGIERSTFLIDESGKLIKEWRKVKVPGHVEAVLSAI